MRIEIVSLFPEFFDVLEVGLLGKAQTARHLEVACVSPRQFTTDNHKTVDDAPYGGGSGMVLKVEPFAEALDHLDQARQGAPSRRVLLSPQGSPFRQRDAVRFTKQECLTLICGRYEGFDERIRDLVDEEVSLGDFVLLGGEVAAAAIIEATCRLLPGVLGNAESATEESFSESLLEYPQYTRPVEFRGERVPDVLLSGHHQAVANWRRDQSLRRTLARRPELLNDAELSEQDLEVLRAIREEHQDGR